MDCQEDGAIGSIIVTLAIISHGEVIDIDLSPEKINILDNVRLFSKSGGFACTGDSSLDNYVSSLNSRFQRNLTNSTLQLVKDYAREYRPVYERDLERNNVWETSSDKIISKSVCNVFDRVTVDKILGFPETMFERMRHTYLSPYPTPGLYLISVHKNKGANNAELLYPICSGKRCEPQLNLTHIEHLKQLCDQFAPSSFSAIYEDLMRKNTPLSRDRFEEMLEWNVSLDSVARPSVSYRKGPSVSYRKGPSVAEHITNIKFSYMVELLKRIFGSECKLNLFDYSCSRISKHVPHNIPSNIRYMEPINDLDAGRRLIGGKFSGGKKNRRTCKRKKRRTRKNKTNR